MVGVFWGVLLGCRLSLVPILKRKLRVLFHVRNKNELVPISEGLLGCPFPSSSICNQDLKITEAMRVVRTAQG